MYVVITNTKNFSLNKHSIKKKKKTHMILYRVRYYFSYVLFHIPCQFPAEFLNSQYVRAALKCVKRDVLTYVK